MMHTICGVFAWLDLCWRFVVELCVILIEPVGWYTYRICSGCLVCWFCLLVLILLASVGWYDDDLLCAFRCYCYVFVLRFAACLICLGPFLLLLFWLFCLFSVWVSCLLFALWILFGLLVVCFLVCFVFCLFCDLLTCACCFGGCFGWWLFVVFELCLDLVLFSGCLVACLCLR